MSPPSTINSGNERASSGVNLQNWPPIYVLPTHLHDAALEDIEDRLTNAGARLTYDIFEARLIIGKVGTKRRAEFEIRCRKLITEEVPQAVKHGASLDDKEERSAKRRRTNAAVTSPMHEGEDSTNAVEDDSQRTDETRSTSRTRQSSKTVSAASSPVTPTMEPQLPDVFPNDQVKIVKLQWLDDSVGATRLLPLADYIVYTGKVKINAIPEQNISEIHAIPPLSTTTMPKERSSVFIGLKTQAILARAKEDQPHPRVDHVVGHGPRRFGASQSSKVRSNQHLTNSLLQQTTTEYEGEESEVPKVPEWMDVPYACQRPTLSDPPNQAFVEQLKRIRLVRTLTLDEIGVRAYSTIIATIAAYPYALTSPRELIELPGCDHKVANLWVEWKNTGNLEEAKKMDEDEMLKVLEIFWNIWGVGPHQARDFYLRHGWRDLDDIIEFGWESLNRMQQIGLKFYEEFQLGIPRSEVEMIASVIRTHASKVRDPGIEVVIVGGHRRGKDTSNDVDVIVSHRTLEYTAGLATDLVLSLERESWITHTLIHSENNTERGQATLPYRAPGVGGGHGFDSLDKALVVWQDPHWPMKTSDLDANRKAKNPNVHRRVDIIISPWRTVGCAIMGWSGGTTFQRDVRRFAKHEKNWKFDSSGIRDRATGQFVALEGPDGVSGSWQDAERKVFEGLGLEYREPWERCTN